MRIRNQSSAKDNFILYAEAKQSGKKIILCWVAGRQYESEENRRILFSRCGIRAVAADYYILLEFSASAGGLICEADEDS